MSRRSLQRLYNRPNGFTPLEKAQVLEDPYAAIRARIAFRLESIRKRLIDQGVLPESIDKGYSFLESSPTQEASLSGRLRGISSDTKDAIRLISLAGGILRPVKFGDWSIDRVDDAANRLGVVDFKALQDLLQRKYHLQRPVHLHKGPGNGKLMHVLRNDPKAKSEWRHIGVGDFLYFSVFDLLSQHTKPKEKGNTTTQQFVEVLSLFLSKALRKAFFVGKGNRDRDYRLRSGIDYLDLNTIYKLLLNPKSWFPRLSTLKKRKILKSREFEDDESMPVHNDYLFQLLLRFRGYTRDESAIEVRKIESAEIQDRITSRKVLQRHLVVLGQRLVACKSHGRLMFSKIEETLSHMDGFDVKSLSGSLPLLLNQVRKLITDWRSVPPGALLEEFSSKDFSDTVAKISIQLKRLEAAQDKDSKMVGRLQDEIKSLKKASEVSSELNPSLEVLKEVFSDRFLKGLVSDRSSVDLNLEPVIYFQGFVQALLTDIQWVIPGRSVALISAVRSSSHESDEVFKKDILGNLEVLAQGGLILDDGFRESYSRRDRSPIIASIVRENYRLGLKAQVLVDQDGNALCVAIQKPHLFGFLTREEKKRVLRPGNHFIPLEEYIQRPLVKLRNRFFDEIDRQARGDVRVFKYLGPEFLEEVIEDTLVSHTRSKLEKRFGKKSSRMDIDAEQASSEEIPKEEILTRLHTDEKLLSEVDLHLIKTEILSRIKKQLGHVLKKMEMQ